MKKDEWDNYFIDNTNVLKNLLGITDKNELEVIEQKTVLKKLSYLYLFPIDGRCDLEHLKQIHSFLFNEIYPFAGKIRTCTLAKNIYNFCEPEKIEEEMSNVIDEFNEKVGNIKTKDEYSFLLAPFYYELIRIPPFREGNGRSIREFVRETVTIKNKELPFDVELDYTKMDSNNLLLGTKERYFYPSLLEMEFMKALVVLDSKKKI